MKNRPLFTLIGGALLVFLGACSSGPRLSRVDAGTQTDLSGNWNDADVRLACNTLVEAALSYPAVMRAIEEYSSKNKGALPPVVVGEFRNSTGEHIKVDIFSRFMRTALINSGRMEFVAGGEAREELRSERQDQLGNASEDTAAALGNETGAVFMLNGEISAMVDRAGDTEVRAYFVSASLTNIETNRIIWEKGDYEIKKVITRPRARL